MSKDSDYQKQYYIKNKESLDAYRKQWAEQNKEKLKKKEKEKLQTDDVYAEKRRLYKQNWHLTHRQKSPELYMLNRSKNRAAQRRIEFTITEKDIVIPTRCPLLDIEFTYSSESTSPSLDRIDNNKGYIPGNVWVISTLANRMKYIATKDELRAFAEGVLKSQHFL